MSADIPISPPPVTGPGDDGLPAYVSNGVIGLRVPAVPLRRGLAMLNGLAALHPVLGIEYSPEAPYPLAGDLAVGTVRLSEWPHGAGQFEQRYDFTCGELHSRFSADLDGTVLDVDVLTFASRSHPALVLQEVAVRPSRGCELSLTALVSTEGVSGRVVARTVGVNSPDGELADGLVRFEPVGGDVEQRRGVVDRGPRRRRRAGALGLVGQRRPGDVVPHQRPPGPHLPVAPDRRDGAQLDALDRRSPRSAAAALRHRPRLRRATPAQRRTVAGPVAWTSGVARRRRGLAGAR